MSKVQRAFLFVVFMGVGFSLVGYQNCSRAQFTSELDGAVLKAEALPSSTDVHQPGDDGQQTMPPVEPTPEGPVLPDEPPVPTPTPSPSPTMPPDVVASPTPNSTPPGGGKNPPKDDKGNSQEQDLVECQLLHPNKKIVLTYEFKDQSSNAASSRVCMSRNACLNILNGFAVNHSRTLDPNAPMAQGDAQAQCTEIFPGSKGTCKNATVLSDEQIMIVLQNMSAKK